MNSNVPKIEESARQLCESFAKDPQIQKVFNDTNFKQTDANPLSLFNQGSQEYQRFQKILNGDQEEFEKALSDLRKKMK